MPKFLSIPVEVEAFQVPPREVAASLLEWLRRHCGGRTTLDRSYNADCELNWIVVVPPGAGPVRASPGDWLVHSAQGLTVCADAEFHAGFRRAGG